MDHYNFIVIGGGAAGVFAALSAKEANPQMSVLLLEKASTLLGKVRVSGGGRCNVTHACFDVKLLVQNYPRGGKALIGPFMRFQPKDTIEWFNSKGVELKTESDGRMFPVTDNSQTIIDCLLNEAQKLKVEIRTKQNVEVIHHSQKGFRVSLNPGGILESDCLLLATGSNPQGYALAKSLGHTIQEPVPSLFTFNISQFSLSELSGISVKRVAIYIEGYRLSQQGPILITHWGFSGPAALKLSAWAARFLHEKKYQATIQIDWIPSMTKQQVVDALRNLRVKSPNQNIDNQTTFDLPRNLWKRLVELSGLDGRKKISQISNEDFSRLSDRLKLDCYQMNGKTTHKEEFVTCGGVSLEELNFKTMESQLCKGLFFSGEIMDVDAVTGGFNFQNAWTTGFIVGRGVKSYLDQNRS